ncbi:MAG: hypothetical protein NHG06_00650 [Candidatus Shikimatogenerans sp. JK-2022]|nr:hypothetical protein [Candidatus Shikimatogenerans bostrichidophilus]
MYNNNFINNLLNKNIDKYKLLNIIKISVLSIFNYNNKYNININFKKGKLIIYNKLLIINDNDKKKFNNCNIILYSKIKNKKKYKVGDYYNNIINLEKKNINLIKKNIYKNINYYLNIKKYKIYKKKIGKIIKLQVKNIFNNILILNDKDNYELYYKLYNKYKIKNNFFKINNYYTFLVNNVFFNKHNNKIKIILSRKYNLLIKKLLKLEVPEILEGIIKIKKIIKIKYNIYKIIVYSKNKKINTIGACIGIKGSRLKNIIKELDVIINIIEYKKNVK